MKKSFIKKNVVSQFVFILVLFVFSGVVSAHVQVFPAQTTQGADDQEFTVRVPTEKNIPTVKVELKVPQGVDIDSIESVTGWEASFLKDKTDKITAITWTATGGGLAPSHFGEFHIVGTVNEHATLLNWKAYQTYQDGTAVNWIGAAGSDHPGPVTEVVKSISIHGNIGSFHASLYLSIAALIVSILALLTSIWKRKIKGEEN